MAGQPTSVKTLSVAKGTSQSILIISTNGAALGGVTRVTLAIASEFRRKGWRVPLYYPSVMDKDTLAKWASEAGVDATTSHEVPLDTGGRSLSQLFRMYRLVRSARVNAVSIHYGGSDLSLKDMLIFVLAGSRVRVAHLHAPSENPASARKRMMTRWAARLATGVVPCSEAVAAPLRLAGVPDNKITVVPGGVLPPPQRLDKAEAQRQLGIPEGFLVVSSIVRLIPEKGISDLIEAVASVRDTERRWHLVVKGDDGPLTERFQREGEAKLGARFTLLPGNTDNGVVYSASDVSALVSYREGYPLVVMEAAMYGLPMVATRVGGIPDQLRGGASGILVDPGDIAAIADALHLLGTDSELRSSMSHEALVEANEGFGAAVMAERMRPLFMD